MPRTKSPVVKSPVILRYKVKSQSPVNLQSKKTSSRRNVSKDPSLKYFIFRLLKAVNPNISISKQGMDVVNSMIMDLFERIASEAGHLTRMNNRSTLSVRDIEGAVKLVVPSELSKFAIDAGKKALVTYNNSYRVDQLQKPQLSPEH